MGDNSGYDKEKLIESFQFIGHNPSDTILAKCLELCISYKVEEEDLVDQWAAFSLTHYKNATPTIDGLEFMERNELSKQKLKAPAAPAPASPEHKKTNINVEESQGATTPKVVRQYPIQNLSQHISCSPASQVEPYSKRPDRGKILLTHGTDTTYNVCTVPTHVKLYGELEHQELAASTKYMFETMSRKRMSISDLTTYIASCIAKKHNLQLPEKYIKEQFSGEYLYGRIVGDSSAQLNNASIVLELPGGLFSQGDRLPMNVSHVKNYTLFPGQVVVTEGNIVKETFVVKQLLTNASRSPGFAFKLPEPLQIIVASGPFTLKNDLDYEPLQDLLKYVLEKKPHILILIGPFLDVDNENVANGCMRESFDSFFHSLVESIMAPLQETNITVVLVASHKDVHHHVVYPTMPYKLKNKYKNLHCVPDPCLLDINGIIFGMTSVDILFHMGKQELCWPSGLGDRMSRLAQYLLNQLCFYPLYPPEKSMSVDYGLLEKFGIMETVPHVLLLPSVFRHFAKNINGCAVINPERLVKGYAGGCFARLNVNCKDSVDVTCQIIRI